MNGRSGTRGRPRQVVAALTVLASSAPAFAHERRTVRELVLQLDRDGAVAMWRVLLRGPDARLLRTMHDLDRDGDWSATERTTLAAAALTLSRGVKLSWDGVDLRPAQIDARLEGNPAQFADRFAALGLATLAVAGDTQSPFDAGAPHTLRVVVAPKTGKLALQIQGLHGWRVISTSRGSLAADRQGLGAPVILAPGEEIEVRIQRRADGK